MDANTFNKLAQESKTPEEFSSKLVAAGVEQSDAEQLADFYFNGKDTHEPSS